jgi:hypothetical protein
MKDNDYTKEELEEMETTTGDIAANLKEIADDPNSEDDLHRLAERPALSPGT